MARVYTISRWKGELFNTSALTAAKLVYHNLIEHIDEEDRYLELANALVAFAQLYKGPDEGC